MIFAIVEGESMRWMLTFELAFYFFVNNDSFIKKQKKKVFSNLRYKHRVLLNSANGAPAVEFLDYTHNR